MLIVLHQVNPNRVIGDGAILVNLNKIQTITPDIEKGRQYTVDERAPGTGRAKLRRYHTHQKQHTCIRWEGGGVLFVEESFDWIMAKVGAARGD